MRKYNKERENRKVLYNIILILAFIGLGLSIYQTVEHYYLSSSVCDFTKSFSCSAVTESRFGELPLGSGIALSVYGLFWWLAVILLTYKSRLSGWSPHKDLYILLLSGSGLLFSIYLVLVELFILPKETGMVIICPFCTVQHVIIAIIFIMSFFLLRKPLMASLKSLFFVKRRLNPKVPFFIAASLLIVFGGYFFLGGNEHEVQHFNFTRCLAENNATMYGFDACPNCNKQKHILGIDAFDKYIDDSGRYVRCRPEDEANISIGNRLKNITILHRYKDRISSNTTQGELCSLMVGKGTPTWIIKDKQESGWMELTELSEMSGCPLPKDYREEKDLSGERFTPGGR